jgi:hypothetical protein
MAFGRRPMPLAGWSADAVRAFLALAEPEEPVERGARLRMHLAT